MKMDRNINVDGTGKYALINFRRLRAQDPSDQPRGAEIARAIAVLHTAGVIDWGRTGDADEFFVVKLKDRHAKATLLAYADNIAATDPEFAQEVIEMANRAGEDSPFCKDPD